MQSSTRVRDLGVVQYGAPLLREPARAVALPVEQAATARVVDQLFAVLDRLGPVNGSRRGLALTAPQIGIGRAVAVVLPAGWCGSAAVLVNPRMTAHSSQVDERYERCLSFFDVRGLVPRSRAVRVESQDLDGTVSVQEFLGGAARLVQHTLDHLDGLLYLSRMRSGVAPQFRPPGEGDSQSPQRLSDPAAERPTAKVPG